MKGDVRSDWKKLGHTRPPMASSSLAAFSSPKIFETRNIKTPFHAGHTGSRANFSMRAIVLEEVEVVGADVAVVVVCSISKESSHCDEQSGCWCFLTEPFHRDDKRGTSAAPQLWPSHCLCFLVIGNAENDAASAKSTIKIRIALMVRAKAGGKGERAYAYI